MFARLWAVIASWFGFGVSRFENPELLLRQYVDELRARIPKLNQAVVEVMKTETLLRREIEAREVRLVSLDQQIIAALRLGPAYENDARALVAALEQTKEQLANLRGQHESAAAAVQQAKQLREDYRSQMEQKCREAMQLIERSKQARLQEELAHSLAAFEVGDQSVSLDRLREVVDLQASRAEARLRVARDHPLDPATKIKRATAAMSVEDRLAEYQRQLVVEPPPTAEAKTMRPVPIELPPAA